MEQPGSHNLAMHAVVAKADATLNSKGEKVYKLAFEFPPEFIAQVDGVVGESVDVYWNEDLVALSATVSGMTTRLRKDEDPRRVVSLDADPGDTERKNLAHEVGNAGDLRLRVMQMSILPRS